jgi:hypothetical protein
MTSATFPERMRRATASTYLLEVHGISRKPQTLAKLAVVGGGPPFRKAGERCTLYDRAALDEWAIALLGPQITKASEYRAGEPA